MEACHMCWKTKETFPVYPATPEAATFCKGCAFDITRVMNALAFALDTSGYGMLLVSKKATLLALGEPGRTYINLWTGELVEGVKRDGEAGSPLEAKSKGEIEGGSPEGGLREGNHQEYPLGTPEKPLGTPEPEVKASFRPKSPKRD